MTNFEHIRSGGKEELIDFLDKLNTDIAVWTFDFDKKFCKNCPAESNDGGLLKEVRDFSYCELCGSCKFFPQLQDLPSNKDVIRWWLDQEAQG